MKKRLTLAALATALLFPAAAAASPAVPFELTESITFSPGTPPTGTFTLDGIGVCSSGTSVDSLLGFNSTFTHIRVERRYSCADGAGSFTAMLVLTIEPAAGGVDRISINWVVTGSDGAIAGLHGAGHGEGSNVGCPRCTGGTSTVTGLLKLG